ncbi:MAG: hypothetical protein IJS53_04935 [Clostridia bacterium]|nr:hypothetical protein [Clostridia bacterium]
MYRLLIATKESRMLDELNEAVSWNSLSFRPPMIVSTAEEAIETMETKRVDCVAYLLDSQEARKLSNYLNTMRPSLPVFELQRTVEGQTRIIRDMRRILDRVHADFSDEIVDEETVMAMLRDELMHRLLAGEIQDEETLRCQLQMLRAHLSPEKECVLYEFDLPQGEIYLNAQWRYGSERLENALRSNFFGRYYEDLYYIVAVLNPRLIRLVVCQRVDRENEPTESLVERADQHVTQTIENIKEYLGLDMVLLTRETIRNLCALTEQMETV